MHLYCVRIKRGRNNANWEEWFKNVSRLNGKSGSFAGIESVCVISHSQSEAVIHSLVTENFKRSGINDVEVTEITRETIEGEHSMYIDLYEDYFKPHNDYPNIG